MSNDNSEVIEAEYTETEASSVHRSSDEIKAFIENLDCSGISDCVYSASQISPDMAKKASIICRRRFKPSDVLVLATLDEDCSAEAGIVFTSRGLFVWSTDDTFEFGIEYSSVINTDYSDTGVIIITEGNSATPDLPEMPEVLNLPDFAKLRSVIDRSLSELKELTIGSRHIICFDDEVDYDEEDMIDYYRNLYAFITDIVSYVHGGDV